MIKHHPKFELLQSYVNGDLPASLAIGISIHASMCPDCQHTIAQLTEQMAERTFEEAPVKLDDLTSYSFTSEPDECDLFESMISNITLSDDADSITEVLQREVVFRDKTYQLPAALSRIELSKAANIGKLSRSRLQLNEDEIHSSLLHINPGGSVPAHTHKGFELTVLLDGSFTDSRGEYNKGDFILLDGTFTHNPVSENGCLCYTVANDALHFTQGINKLLNPIGSFIY